MTELSPHFDKRDAPGFGELKRQAEEVGTRMTRLADEIMETEAEIVQLLKLMQDIRVAGLEATEDAIVDNASEGRTEELPTGGLPLYGMLLTKMHRLKAEWDRLEAAKKQLHEAIEYAHGNPVAEA